MPSGHGQIGVGDRKTALAHRVSWELHRGPITRGLNCCRKCDNGSCVRPSHLFLGTQVDNLRDMAKKGRQALQARPESRSCGERNGNHSLTARQVIEFRRRYALGNVSQRSLADEYKIHPAPIWRIVVDKTWRPNRKGTKLNVRLSRAYFQRLW